MLFSHLLFFLKIKPNVFGVDFDLYISEYGPIFVYLFISSYSGTLWVVGRWWPQKAWKSPAAARAAGHEGSMRCS